MNSGISGVGFKAPEMGGVQRIHFVGIGGAGMSGIAEVLINQGYEVSGSDLHPSAVTARLASLGARVFKGHAPEQVAGADVVVRSSAIDDGNPEIVDAHERRIPVIARAEMLGELMRYRHGIAIAGTHGKTTTTSLLTAIYQAAGLDPTFVIGGLLESAGAHARLGMGQAIIVEADESDASFLRLQPMLAVITNIDSDHMATYGHDFERLQDAFIEFVHRLPFYGVAVLCLDDPVLRRLLPRISRPILTYGFAKDADFSVSEVAVEGRCWRFRTSRPEGRPPLEVSLAAPGRHNVQNALAAIAAATHEGIGDQAILQGLAEFGGVGRRFQIFDGVRVGACKVTLVDDYGHHPTEIRAVLRTARQIWPERRFLMAYQPHRFSRTRELYDAFVRVLAEVDRLVLMEVYPAGEAPINGADGAALCRSIQAAGAPPPVFASSPDEALRKLPSIVADGDVLLVQGAGNVSEVSKGLRGAHAA